jgi:hypothetical protein
MLILLQDLRYVARVLRRAPGYLQVPGRLKPGISLELALQTIPP